MTRRAQARASGRLTAAVLLSIGAVACDNGMAREVSDRGKPAEKAATSASTRTAPNGTRVTASIQQALSSRTNKSGDTFTATVSADVMDDSRRIVIPAGSVVNLSVDKIEPGSAQVRSEGRLSLLVTSMVVAGREYPVVADLEPVAHEMKGRGVTTDEVARVGAGTAIGAVVGQAISKNTKGTVIGGAVGAATGAVVAQQYAYHDVIVAAGTPIAFTLARAVVISMK